MNDQSIIDELLRRKKAGTLKADATDVPCKVRPIARDQIAKVESLLGYDLPLLLTRMYTEVANGGFGDSYGLLGLKGGPKNEAGFDSTRLLKELRKPDPDDRFWKWPDGLLPIGSNNAQAR